MFPQGQPTGIFDFLNFIGTFSNFTQFGSSHTSITDCIVRLPNFIDLVQSLNDKLQCAQHRWLNK